MALEDQIAALATATTELTDQALVTLGESAANADRAELARDFSTQEANRATAAQSAITTELAQVQALAEQVASDKAGVTATLIGSENYIIPAVTQLLSTYTNVVATAISDDIWAENSHKWGAPKQVLAIAQTDKVVLIDLTKPTFPKFWDSGVHGVPSANALLGWSGDNATVSSVSITAGTLAIGKRSTGTNGAWHGVIVVDFATDVAIRITNVRHEQWGGAVIPAPTGKWPDGAVSISTSRLAHLHVNSIATRIADHAPRHPVSGLPMPTIVVATDGGVSELVPTDDGKWTVRSWSDTEPHGAISYTQEGRLLSSKISGGITYDLSAITAGTALTTANRTYGLASGSTLRNLDGGTTVNSTASKQFVKRGLNGLSMFRENPSSKAAGMVAFASTGYSTPYLVGDVQGAWLCGSEEGVVSGDNLVASGLTVSGAFVQSSAGVFDISLSAAEGAALTKSNAITVGVSYSVEFTVSNYVDGGIAALVAGWEGITITGDGTYKFVTKAATTTSFQLSRSSSSCHFTISNIVVKRAILDYSGRNNHAIIHGSLTRTKPVGSDIAVWSGFADAGTKVPLNYIEHLFTPSDALVLTLAVKNSASGSSYDIAANVISSWDGTPAGAFSSFLRLQNDNNSFLKFYSNLAIFSAPSPATEFTAATAIISATKVAFYVNGQVVGEATGATVMPTQPVRMMIGTGLDASGSACWNGSIAELTYTKTIPSDDQIREMHRDMLNKLSKPSVLSGNVKALAYDPIRKQDWVACDSKKLHRLDGTCIVETVMVDTNVGTISSLTVNDGLITVGGSGGTWVKQPEKNLRAPQVRAGKSVRTFELGDGNGTKVDFYLPRGWKPERAYVDGVKKRKGAQDDWTAQFDGYKWFVRFAVPPGAVDVDVDAVEV